MTDAAEAAEIAEAAEAAEIAEAAEAGDAVDGSPVAEARAAHPLAAQLEALLLVADEPLSVVTLATATARPVAEVRAAILDLVADYDGAAGGPRRGFELREIAGGYRYYVREGLDPLITDFMQQQSPQRLSQAALETLAVIAYRQPISRGAIASIRAVNVDSVVRTLLARGLVTEVGHDPQTGAILYGTDASLLGYLGIASLDELPPIAPLLDDPGEGFDGEQF